ncbi:toprim domain-containing protein (plasmid) [Nocardia pseudovaccinii]|uniref:toprim domain-containing protein n=1 Tax=Nocardia pseudovaccinii TaxID=189540 RepID=UPI003D94FF2F
MTTTQHGSFETITAALEREVGMGRASGAWTKYCCPVHEAGGGHHNPSLGVKYSPAEQRTKVRCFAGCDDRDVLGALGLKVRDLFDTPITRTRDDRRRAPRVRPRQITRADRAIDAAGLPLTKPHKDLGRQTSAERATATYPYARPDGTVAGEVIRKEARYEHGTGKSFYQRRWTENGMQAGGFEPIPFQLPRVLDAIEAGEPIFIVEGEKDVLAAEQAGVTATCNAMGAGKWRPEHAQWLRGATEVVIVADRDAPGYRHADRVMDSLAGHVGRIRVVQARDGKDLSDHLSAGHDIGELDPIPFLDPHTTRSSVAAASTAGQIAATAGVVTPTTTPEPNLDGGTPMDAAPIQHDDTVDHMGSHFSRFLQQLFQQILMLAQHAAEQRRRAAEKALREAVEEQREYAVRQAAEQKAVETRLAKMAKQGWDTASRSELAAALQDAAAWAPDSQYAKHTLAELAFHIRARYGVAVDPDTGKVTVEASQDVVGALAAVERDRATASRVRTAQDQMTAIVAAEPNVDESNKPGLYADIEEWRRNPSGRSLSELGQKMKAAGVGEKTRARVRFAAVYLALPEGEMPIAELGAVAALSATAELRRMGEPLVDPGEVIKPQVDELLVKYQDYARTGRDTSPIAEQLSAAIAVMTPEDQETARERGKAIRSAPSGVYKPLWPDHVDRRELDAVVRMYAMVAPQVEGSAANEEPLDPAAVTALRERAAKHRGEIDRALRSGEGLHELEKIQLKAVLRDIEAGKTEVPELLFADDTTAAALDASRSDQIAHDTNTHHRRQLDQILSTASVPPEVARHADTEIRSVFHHQTQLAAGHWSLGDYEQRGTAAKLDAHLNAAGISEPVRNRVRNHLDQAAGECAIAGKQARRIQERWDERRELVAASRAAVEPVSYDSDQRRQATEAGLRSAGLSERVISARMAADAGHATPPSAAVNNNPGKERGARRTAPGQGVYRATHRGRGDQRGQGK